MQFRKSSLMVKLVILALIIAATFTLVRLRSQLQQINAENTAKTSQLNMLTQENEKLAADDDDLQSYRKEYDAKVEAAGDDADKAEIAASIDSDAMEELAREQGYVDPGEIVFEDVNN